MTSQFFRFSALRINRSRLATFTVHFHHVIVRVIWSSTFIETRNNDQGGDSVQQPGQAEADKILHLLRKHTHLTLSP